MGRNKNYVEEEVVFQLNNKHDIRIAPMSKQIQELQPPYAKGDTGIHSRGKIDFLINHKGYVHFYVSKF